MSVEDKFTDYYKILQCQRTATIDEIKKNYQRLLLSSHPDKMNKNNSDGSFLLIQKAWSILKDPCSRKQYDAIISCYENSEILLYDTISLSDMSLDSTAEVYSYNCRCGGSYSLNKECIESVVIVGCDECSFSIQINL